MDDRSGSSEVDGLNPGVARDAGVWNYWPGGKDHYPADREVGFPNIVHVARPAWSPAPSGVPVASDPLFGSPGTAPSPASPEPLRWRGGR
ncbi:hypothetical protein [Streptosporangium saharense]|uniref:hypothetical protein n=1 Tax=Streptosporangium saharense TaxID=1706840 RepID=UPI003323FACF